MSHGRRRRWLRVGFALGFVMGTKAGRERYEEMRRAWLQVWNSGPVQEAEARIRATLGLRTSPAGHHGNGVVATSAFADLPGPGVPT